MTIANIITLVRILLIPMFMVAALSGGTYGSTIALTIFIIASVTDGVDGYIARKYKQITTLGKFLDPLADKLLVTSAILVFVQNGVMSAAAAMIIITREFAVTSLRIVAMGEGKVIAARMSGKVKTVVQIVTIALLFTPYANLLIFGVAIDDIAIWIMVAVTVISGFEYFRGFGKLLKIKGNETK